MKSEHFNTTIMSKTKKVKRPYGKQTIFVNNPHEIVPGQEATYYPTMGPTGPKSEGVKTTILGKPWQLGHGDWLVKIEGKSGGVSIEHLDILL